MPDQNQLGALMKGKLTAAMMKQAIIIDAVIFRLMSHGAQGVRYRTHHTMPGHPMRSELMSNDVRVLEVTTDLRGGESFEMVSTVKVYPDGRPEELPFIDMRAFLRGADDAG